MTFNILILNIYPAAYFDDEHHESIFVMTCLSASSITLIRLQQCSKSQLRSHAFIALL